MTKKELARIIEQISWRARKEHFDVDFYDTDLLSKDSSEEWLVGFFSRSAGAKLIKGRITLKGEYLVSRGKELPFCKPNAVAEYSSHWPYDFCYFYRL